MYSAGCPNRLVEWAREMSGPRKARLTSTNRSSQSRESRSRLGTRAMGLPQFVGLGLQLDAVLEHRVVAVPLHEVGPTHERPVFGGAAVVVPQVEVQEV